MKPNLRLITLSVCLGLLAERIVEISAHRLLTAGFAFFTSQNVLAQNEVKKRKFKIEGEFEGVAEIERFDDFEDFENEKAIDETEEKSVARRAAVFVFNHIGEEWNNEMRALEDLVVAQVTRLGFDIVSREVAIDALKKFPGQSAGDWDDLDDTLLNDSSALRLAQNLGANYLLYVSLTSFGTSIKEINAYGAQWAMINRNLVLTYRIAEGMAGSSVISDSVEVEDSIRKTKFAQTTDSNKYNRMLLEGARKIGASLKKQLKTDEDRLSNEGLGELVEVEISVTVNGISFPDIVVDANGNFEVTKTSLPVEVSGVIVELDGTVIGSAPSKIQTSPGLHRIRLSREGFKDWERMVNIFGQPKFSVALEFDEEGLRRWKANTAFVKQLKREALESKSRAELNQADADRLRGVGEFFRQSGLRVNLDFEDMKDGEALKSIFKNFEGILN